MRAFLGIVLGLLISSGASAQNAPGRWQLLPVYGPPIDVKGTPHYLAWRLDTETGALQMCTYDPGGWKRPEAPEGVVKERLECSAPLTTLDTSTLDTSKEAKTK
jgi:hypothetical protein